MSEIVARSFKSNVPKCVAFLNQFIELVYRSDGEKVKAQSKVAEAKTVGLEEWVEERTNTRGVY